MIHLRLTTYQPSNFPIIDDGTVLTVRLKGYETIGYAKVISSENEKYTLELELEERVSQDLYPTITWSSTNGIIDTHPYLSLSDDNIYERFIPSIGKQLNG